MQKHTQNPSVFHPPANLLGRRVKRTKNCPKEISDLLVMLFLFSNEVSAQRVDNPILDGAVLLRHERRQYGQANLGLFESK